MVNLQRCVPEDKSKRPEFDGSSMSPAVSRRYALRGSGETLVLLAASTMCTAGLVQLPYADMLTPSQSSPTTHTAPRQGPWGEWLRIIASFCSCGGGCDGDGSTTSSTSNDDENTTTNVDDHDTTLLTATTASSSAGGCCCCAAVAIESLVQQAKAQSAKATPRTQCILSAMGDCGSGVPAAEDLLTRAIHHLCDSDWVDWLRIPLIGAASQGDLDTVRLLLKAGFGGPGSRGIGAWMIPGGDGRTLLHAAADSGNAVVIEALLDAGAGVVVNAVTGHRGGRQNTCGFSPFHVAVIKGSVPAAMALARAGAAVHRRAPFQQSALHLAAGTGNAEMVYALVTDLRLAVEGRDDLGGTALHAAAWHGEAECVRALLALGAQVDTRDECGRSPLFQACRCGGGGDGGGGSPDGWKAVCELVGAGADVNAKSEDGDTPLHIACRYGHTETVHILLRHDADETARCDLGKTPGDVTRGAALRAARRRSRCGNTGGGGNGVASGGNNNDFPLQLAEAIHAALAAAPAGRAWRRRGWIVMLRTRLIEFDKLRLAESMPSAGSTEEADQVFTGSFEVGAGGRSMLASLDLSVGMLVQDANGSVSLPQAWAAMDLEEERDFSGPLEGLLPLEHFQENGITAGFGMDEMDETRCGVAVMSGTTKRPSVSVDCVRGFKRLCSRKHGFLGGALKSVSDGFAVTASGGLGLREMDISADNFVDLALDSFPSSSEKGCAPSGGGSGCAGVSGFRQQDASTGDRASCVGIGGGSSHTVVVGGATIISDDCSTSASSSTSGGDRVDMFYDVVLRTLEMADGPFEIIVGYV
eukprot:g8033.t1